ncbi:ShlB/FhaC/HecB family hemolysin secretion/activation protein [Shewanella sp. 125m-7]
MDVASAENKTAVPDNNHAEDYEQKKPTKNIVIKSNDIFDLSDPDTFFIHRWANYLHINTRDSVIRDKLSFSEGNEVSQKDLDEAQRILRSQAYIRDAKISYSKPAPDADLADEGENILVETWDNWSLLPTFSASRSGGENKFSIGIKEDNLLGYGIRTRIKYQSNADRTGYKFGVEAPFNYIKYATIAAEFYDNSDGQAKHVYFNKPFYTLDGSHMYSAEYLDDLRVDTLKQNGMDINEFQHSVFYNNARFGWLINHNSEEVSRFITGITQDRNEFNHIDSYPTSELPQDRDFLYPWLAYQYLEDDFKVLKNVHLINYNEDFNFGWQHYFKLGIETRDLNDSSPIGYHVNWQSSRGYQGKDQLILFEMDGEGVFATSQKDFYKLNVAAEYFYHISPKWTAYSKLRLSTSQNNYLDEPFALGDDTGVRGYPNDYQYGDNQWAFTAEIRNYPNINLYQLAELGWAVFTDVGHAFGGGDENNDVTSPIGSVGIGARIYSSKSSYGNVAHIDISMPFTSGVEVNSWEWRFQVKNRF